MLVAHVAGRHFAEGWRVFGCLLAEKDVRDLNLSNVEVKFLAVNRLPALGT
jgi:hypothetical protein